MKSIQLGLAPALFLFVLAGAFAQSNALQGEYNGQLVSDGEYLETVTTFVTKKGGQVSGSYVFTESSGREVEGRLKLVKREAPLVFLFSWEDEYGEGYLRLLFASDYSTFSGYWGTEADSVVYPWNGSLSLEEGS